MKPVDIPNLIEVSVSFSFFFVYAQLDVSVPFILFNTFEKSTSRTQVGCCCGIIVKVNECDDGEALLKRASELALSKKKKNETLTSIKCIMSTGSIEMH